MAEKATGKQPNIVFFFWGCRPARSYVNSRVAT